MHTNTFLNVYSLIYEGKEVSCTKYEKVYHMRGKQMHKRWQVLFLYIMRYITTTIIVSPPGDTDAL